MIFAIGYFQPSLIRSDFYSVYWFNKELARIVYSTRENPLGLGKLDFWQESVENIYKASAADRRATPTKSRSASRWPKRSGAAGCRGRCCCGSSRRT
jgi:phytoene/squalene synthetase